jgi:hypothetical protein
MASWTADAKVRIHHLKDEIDRVSQSGQAPNPRLTAASVTLEEAESHLAGAPRAKDALSGSGPKIVWGMLHEVEETIDDLDQDVGRLHREAIGHLKRESAADKDAWERKYARARRASRARMARAVIHEAHIAAEDKHTSELNQRRGISVFSSVLIGVAIAVVVLQVFTPAPFLPAPQDAPDVSGASILLLVMLFGCLGGLLSGLVALYLAPTDLDNTRWFDPKPTLVYAKASVGLWTAVIGVAAVGTGVIVGIYQNLAALLLLALMFGYSQQAVTTFIDKRAASMLEAEESKEK